MLVSPHLHFFTAGKPDYKREHAASETVASHQPLEASDPLLAESWQQEDSILSTVLVLLSTSPCENSVRTKHSFKTVLR